QFVTARASIRLQEYNQPIARVLWNPIVRRLANAIVAGRRQQPNAIRKRWRLGPGEVGVAPITPERANGRAATGKQQEGRDE
ncbi:MAG: hypothetical protein ACI9SE_001052, partial [Neolewinella sp.]